MRWLRTAIATIRALVRRDGIAHEIRDELDFHLDMRAAEYRSRGLNEAEATRLARRRFGNPVVLADQGYDIRGAGIMETIWQDVRYAIRQLRRERGLALVAITTLALAMGASTALFSVIDAALIRPVPYPEAERIVTIRASTQFDGRDGTTDTYSVAPSFDDLALWRQSENIFAAVGRARLAPRPLIVEGQRPERLPTSLIGPEFLDVFGVTPVVGRRIGPDDTRQNAAPVVLLGYDYWQREYAGQADVVGETLRVDGVTSTIVGVLPAWFYRESAVWRPMPDDPLNARGNRGSGTPTYGRLLPGVELTDAAARLTAVSTALEDPSSRARLQAVQLDSLYEDTTDGYRPALRLLGATVLGILLIACLNVSGLLLARGARRGGELSIRASIGAGRWRLVRQLLTESLVIAAAAGFAGVALAWLLLDTLVAILPLTLPANAAPVINGTVMAGAAGLTVATTVLFGLLPALRVAGRRLTRHLSHVGRQHRSPLAKRTIQFLIAGQLALALVLLAGTGLMLRSLSRALSIDVGFNPASFLTLEVYPVDNSVEGYAGYFPALLERVRAMPGVVAAGTIDFAPLSGAAMYTDAIVNGQSHFSAVKEVSSGFFEALGLAAISGRLPTTQEAGPTAVLSESAARAMFPDGRAIGLTLAVQMAPTTPLTVVGVVPDIRSRDAFTYEPDRPDVYLVDVPKPAETPASWLTVPKVIIRPVENVTGIHDALREAATSIGPPAIVGDVRIGSEWFGDNIARTRDPAILMGLLGGLGLVLASVGVFGLTAYAVSRRTHEVGVRMAFGARPMEVVRMILRDACWPVLIGVGLGLYVTWHASQLIESFLYDTPPREPVTFAIVAALTAVVALAAAWIPARRAAKVDPVAALRAE